MATLTIYSDYGYVIIVLCLSWVLINWLALQVMKARKRFEIKVGRATFSLEYLGSKCGTRGLDPREHGPQNTQNKSASLDARVRTR